MTKTKQNETAIKIGNWIAPRLDKSELILSALIIAGLAMKPIFGLQLNIAIILLFSISSVMYFFNSFSDPDSNMEDKVDLFIKYLTYWSLSIGLLGILFRLQSWPGSDRMIIVGCSTLIVLFPVILIRNSKKPDSTPVPIRLLLRILLIGSLGLLLNFADKDYLTDIGLIDDLIIEKSE